MSIETELYDALTDDAGVTAIIGEHVYPDFLSQEIELPALVYERTETDYVTTIHSGAVEAARVSVAIWCLALTRIATEQLADAVETALGVQGEFYPLSRAAEFNPDTLTPATVLTYFRWQ